MRTLPITTKRVGDDEEAKTEDEIEIRFVHGERRVEKSPGLKAHSNYKVRVFGLKSSSPC
jgi:hypothetical protein